MGDAEWLGPVTNKEYTVELIQSSSEYENEEWEGTTFTVALPQTIE